MTAVRMRSLLRPLDEWLWRYLVSSRKFVCRRADHHFQPSSLTFILHPGHFYNNKQLLLIICMDVFTAPWKPWTTHQQQHCLGIAAGLMVWVVTMYVGFGRATCAEGGGVTFQRRRLHFWLLTVCCSYCLRRRGATAGRGHPI
jgi:hypothetical protein